MSKLGEILINETRKKMEFHKRNASGKASESLREVAYDGGVRIMGIDYFNNIFNGIPSGSGLSLSTLNNWATVKQSRYNVGIGGRNVLKNILEGNAWINKQPEKLNIDKKVLTEQKTNIDKEVRRTINRKIKVWMHA